MQTENRQNTEQQVITHFSDGIYSKYLKRPLDIILSIVMLVLLSPLVLVLYVLVKIKCGSPVVFKQYRPGHGEKIFKIFKFRTMTSEKDEKGELLPDGMRLTEFGRFLRATSLDELPELFNILIGDMSFVGPRPHLIKEIVFMNDEQRKRHKVLPGLTGLAQINGRNELSWDERLALDTEYIKTISFWGDCKILFLTAVKVLKREGVNTNGMDTFELYGDYVLRSKLINEQAYIEKLEISKSIENSLSSLEKTM